MKNIVEIRKALDEIQHHNPNSNDSVIQMKTLGVAQAKIQLNMIETMERLDRSNKSLTRSNFWLQVFIAILTVVTVYKALYP